MKLDTCSDNQVCFTLSNDASDVLKARWTEEKGVDSSDTRVSHSEIERLLWEAALSLGLTP